MEMEQDYQQEAELELGLGLTLKCGGYLSVTNKPTAPISHNSSPRHGSGQIVGWPPVRTYRMNSLVNQAKISDNEAIKGVGRNDQIKVTLENMGQNTNKNDTVGREKVHFGFVKVNIDGMKIGRKVDLNAHSCYETLAQALEEMFLKPSINSICGEKQTPTMPSKLLDGSSEFVLTYEDKEGDSMLVGDVPWRMFLNTVKRLRIMKTSEAGGLAPRSQERNTTEKSKRPI